MLVREMKEEDLQAVLTLDQSLFSHSYLKEDYLYELNKNQYAHLYVLIEDHQIIGFIDYWVIYERSELARIAISKKYQSKGLGQYLFNTVSSYYKDVISISLEVRTSNESAIRLYKKLGFIQVAVRKNYYENKEDALLMVKEV